MAKISYIFLLFVSPLQAQMTCDSALVKTAEVTYYTLLDQGNGGNCSFINDSIKPYYVAVNNQMYYRSATDKAADACGTCLQMTGKNGSVTVQVVDRCPSCKPGSSIEFDLSPKAYQKVIGPFSSTNRKVYWRVVPCPFEQKPLSIRLISCNAYFVKLFVSRSVNQIKTVEILSAGKWLPMTHGPDNGWTRKSLGTAKAYDIRVSDFKGESIVFSQVNMVQGNRILFADNNFTPCDTSALEQFVLLPLAPIVEFSTVTAQNLNRADYVEFCNLQGFVLDAYQLSELGFIMKARNAYPKYTLVKLYRKGKLINEWQLPE